MCRVAYGIFFLFSLNFSFVFLSDMDALFQRLHNFMLPLMRGKDHVCQCTCGSHEAYHVVPFYGGLHVVDSTRNYFGSDIMSRQEKDVIAGLLLGLCIGWFLLWLNGIWHLLLKVWRANQHDNFNLWSWILPKSRNSTQQHPKDSDDSNKCSSERC